MSSTNTIAIIGHSFRLPGGIDTSDDLWQALLDDSWPKCNTSAPPSRLSSAFETKTFGESGPRGGWLGRAGVEEFDPCFFGISPGEAESLRPNTRLALELTWEALERAAIPPSSLAGKNVSVTIGMGNDDGWDLRQFARRGPSAFDHQWGLDAEPSAVAGRVAQFFDFQGATSTMSSACASGIAALDHAVHTLNSHGAEIAVVGALSTYFSPAAFLSASAAGLLSPSGRCRAFSDDADGYNISEGAVFFVLKKSDLAIADGDVIDALIRSVSVSHSGRTPALSTPKISAQQVVQLRALERAGVTPNDISYLEAQGTGTPLGDKMELKAIKNIYCQFPRDSPLFLSTCKTVLGHCYSASALVAMLKVILCFKHRAIPPHHVPSYLNESDNGIMVPNVVVPVEKEKHMFAAINAFAATGIVSSIIMEEPPSRRVPGLPTQQSYILPFSGRTEPALRQYMMAVRAWSRKVECDLDDLAALLTIARDHHSIRKVLVVNDIHDFYRQTDSSVEQSGATTIPVSHELQDIQCLYEAGRKLPGADIYSRHALKTDLVHSFPTYPFERQCHFPSREIHLIPQPVHNATPSLRASSPLEAVRSAVASIRGLDSSDVKDGSNIFELGMNCLHSIDLARHLSRALAKRLSVANVYRLMTVQAIADFLASQRPEGKLSLQDKAEQLIEEFSSPLEGFLREKASTAHRNTAVTVLLTGATGFVGSNLLGQLLQLPSVKVVCLIRGDPLPRLRKVFSQHALDDTALDRKLHSGSLQILKTTDLSHEYLGCTPDAYSSLIASVDYVVHCAWRMDFNFPMDGFRGDLTTVRRIAQLCASCEKPATLFFASSFSTTMGYGSTVPEALLPLDLKFSLYQGYAHSKLVAEHILCRLLATSAASFRLRILRIGQVCGHSKTGAWVDNELVPMLLSMLPDQRTMLGEMPDVSWIPSDICARAICDLVVHETSTQEDQANVTVHNLANPHIRCWKDVVVDSCGIIGCEVPEFVALSEFVDMLGDADSPMSGKRLLPYFSYTLEAGGLPSHYASLDVSQTAGISKSLKACPPVDITLLRILISRLFPNTALPIRSTAKELAASPMVFMFGPWSSVQPGMVLSTIVSGMVDEFTDIASTTLRNRVPHRDHSAILARGSALHYQFITLATHIDTIQQLRGLGVSPTVVAGYCFGEFSAAVCRGFLTAREAVELISLRAYAIDHLTSCHTPEDARDCTGAACDATGVGETVRGVTMLNVFAPADIVRKQLLRISSPVPEIAIIVGPTHTVLSGSPEAIHSAQKYYQQEGLKVKTVETHIPFHSAEIEPAIALLTKLLPGLPGSGSTDQSQCAYVSGLTGRVLRMPSLGRSYWLRHMRQTFLFQNVVETISHTFGSSNEEVVVVDLGPGPAVTNMVKRVNCSNLKVVALHDVLGNNAGLTARPLANGSAHKSKLGPEARMKTNGIQNGHAKAQRPRPDACVSMHKRVSTCLEVLSELRNHHDTEDVLYETISTLVDSIQFIRLTSMLKDELGVTFPPAAYASSAPIIELLEDLR